MYPSEKSVVELHLLSRVSLVSFALIRQLIRKTKYLVGELYFPNFGSQVLFFVPSIGFGPRWGAAGVSWFSIGAGSWLRFGWVSHWVGGWVGGECVRFFGSAAGRWGRDQFMFWLFYGVDYIRGTVPSGVVCVFRFVNRFLWVSMSLGGCGVESLRKFHTYNYIHAFYTYM